MEKPKIPLPNNDLELLNINPPDMSKVDELKDLVIEKKKMEMVSIFKTKLHSYVDRIEFNEETGILNIPEALLDIKGHLNKIFKVE